VGDATSTEYYGSLHDAWFEDQWAGMLITACLVNGAGYCPGLKGYGVLHGTTPEMDYKETDGWMVLRL